MLSPMVWAEEGQVWLAGSCRTLRGSGPDAVGWTGGESCMYEATKQSKMSGRKVSVTRVLIFPQSPALDTRWYVNTQSVEFSCSLCPEY